MNRVCAHCSKPFDVHPSRLKHGRGRHCSPACQYAAAKGRPKRVARFQCVGCGDSFTRPNAKSNHPGNGKYCSRACRDKHRVGANSPNWRDGSGIYKRGPNWHSIRRRILKRDKCCQHCGATEGLHVHHKVPFRMWRNADDANADANLVALCPPCHRREDARFVWIGKAA